jgi:hypothetical protein
MSRDDSSDGKLSPKEFARKQRQAAYRRAKEQRARDPKHLAMKEALKLSRRAAYQKIKERRKVAFAEQKVKRKIEAAEKRSLGRAAADAELMKSVEQMKAVKTWMAKGSNAEN